MPVLKRIGLSGLGLPLMRTDLLFIVTVSPTLRQVAIEVLSEILTFAAFDIPLRVLFLDRAAKLLITGADPEIYGMIEAFSLYGVSEVFVERESLIECGVDEQSVPGNVIILRRAEISHFIRMHRRVMGD